MAALFAAQFQRESEATLRKTGSFLKFHLPKLRFPSIIISLDSSNIQLQLTPVGAGHSSSQSSWSLRTCSVDNVAPLRSPSMQPTNQSCPVSRRSFMRL